MLERVSVAIFGCAALILTPTTGNAQDSSCQLSIEGSGTSNVFINASGCTGDTIAVVAGAEGNQKQFPAGNGPELSQPFNVSQCDFDVSADHPVGVNYTLMVVSGPDKGKSSTTYSGKLDPDPKLADNPPTVSLSGEPSPGLVRPGDVITLSVTANDDYGLTAVRVTDPGGQVLLDKRITPAPRPQLKCHQWPAGQSVTLQIPKPYVVPPNPPTPVIRFTAVARDTAGKEATGFIEYLTEAMWTGNMLLAGSGGVPGNTCTTNWRIALWVKTSPQNEVTGTAEARHDPIQGCRYAGPRDTGGVMSFAITGTFDGKLFRLFFKPTGGAGIAWGIGGLHLLTLPTPLPIDLTLASNTRDYASGSLGRDNSGNVEGRGTASIAGRYFLQCCFSDTGPAAPAKGQPIFLGEDNK